MGEAGCDGASVPSVFLIGYRGAGKSSVGLRLAERLSRPFADSDRLIETRCGKSIARIFAEEGERAFRDREEEVVRELAARAERERLVVALGGGVVLRPGNIRAVHRAGCVVWLDADPDSLAERLERDPGTASSRPPLRGGSAAGEVAEVLAARRPLYERAAHLRVWTSGKTVEEVVEEILRVLTEPGSWRTP